MSMFSDMEKNTFALIYKIAFHLAQFPKELKL